jgi:hypothetical protein
VTTSPTLFSAADYAALAAIVFRPDYPGNATARGVVEAPNGDPAARDTGKRYAHVAVKYLPTEYGDWTEDHDWLYWKLSQAHARAVTIANALGVPREFMPSRSAGALRVLEYPPGAGSAPHTDMDLFTLNLWRNMPTQVNSSDLPAHVRDVEPRMHIGELGELIGMGPATRHEVAPCHQVQHSIVYFAIPNHAAVLSDHPLAKAAAGSDYPNILVRGKTVGEWLAERLARSRYTAGEGEGKAAVIPPSHDRARAAIMAALEVIDDLVRERDFLRAQCHRDFQLAAEWKERYESARTDAEVLRTRLENPHR